MARLVPSAFAVVVILAAQNALCFLPNFGGKSITHSDITKMAALRAVLKLFQELPSPEGKLLPHDAFQPEGEDLTAEKLFEAYYGATVSVSRFKHALKTMTISNTKVDLKYVLDGKRHFDSETLLEAKRILLRQKARVIKTIIQGKYNTALRTMGTMLHTLQDFYSHSNWIELGFKTPNTNLIKPEASIGTIAGKTERTCTDCSTVRSCKDKILDSIIQRKVITTGYFGFNPSGKPEGKCSHGGTADLSKQGSEGINKDSVTSPHSQYHTEAARVATEASLEVFQEVRDTVGDEAFLKFLKVNSPTGLSFVIDTTGSMSDDIEAAKQRTITIVKNRRGTRDAPSFYVLVPFNDPEFGPVFKTSDPDKFIEQLRMLRAGGGGDIPEMSLSALQLALTNTPPLSYIYVFTDAPAKDFELSRTIVALIEQTQCKVSFLLTNVFSRRRRSAGHEHGNMLYKHLAQVSGGLAVIIPRQLISQLTAIIADTATAALVIVTQRDSNPAYLENSFPFHVDHALHNITIYISGNPAKFRISNPRGVQQSSTANSGDLGSVEHIGDLSIVRLHSPTDVGEWDLIVSSGTQYSVKVTGQSVVDFMYDFIESFPGPHPGFAPLSGRPMAGTPVMLEITVTGLPIYPSFVVQEFALLDPQGEVLQKEALRPTASPDTFMVEFQSLPVRGFYVRMSGQEQGNLPFRRQSTTLNSVTNTKVKVITDPTFRAGTELNVSFTITNSGSSSLYKVRLTDDQNLSPSQPLSFNINSNQSVEGHWVISAPNGMEPGTLLTLTIEAESQVDFGYSIVQLIITSQVEDLSPPTCAITSMSRTCPPADREECGLQRWSLTAQFVESGTGQVAVYARRGNGSLAQEEKRDGGRSMTLAHYNASCCFPDVDLVGVDLAGNVGTCSMRANNRGPGPACYSTAILLATYLASCLSYQLA